MHWTTWLIIPERLDILTNIALFLESERSAMSVQLYVIVCQHRPSPQQTLHPSAGIIKSHFFNVAFR